MGRNELVYQVPVRAVKLHPVKTCFQSISGCLGVELNQFLYLLGGQGSWGRWVGQCARAGASFDEHFDVVRADG